MATEASSNPTGAGETAPTPLDARLTGVHAVIILPEWSADIGRHYDAATLIGELAAAPTQVVEFCIKPALGHPLFPLGDRPCPKDWATETRRLAAEAGQRFVAYYNIGLDNRIGGKFLHLMNKFMRNIVNGRILKSSNNLMNHL